MTIIDLSRFQTLKEGIYSNAVLNKINFEFYQDHPDHPKWLNTEFVIDGHQIRDRFFVDGDDRFEKLVASIQNVQDDLKLEGEIWSNMPCSVRLTHDAINERKFWHTHDWKWDSETYRQRLLKVKQTDKLSQGSGQGSLLEDVKKRSDEPDDDLFKGVFDKDGDN
ncbi:hypothetical protein Nizo1840_0006 [Lactiplantibacillus plantarum]|nr:hypothetical protein Nizo1840_0006 [Lactiplantibacillus plantarum]